MNSTLKNNRTTIESEKTFFCDDDGVSDCKATPSKDSPDISKYFHPVNITLTRRFDILYELFRINDLKLARKIGIDKSTMNRYRRGVFYPTNKMKLLIAQAMSDLVNYRVDSSVIWGSDLFFENFREEQKKIGESRLPSEFKNGTDNNGED